MPAVAQVPAVSITAFQALTNYPGEGGPSEAGQPRRYNALCTLSHPGTVLPHPEPGAAPAFFQCRFKVAFEAASVPLYYALFYQNESYAFPAGHPRDDENFYGTWGYDEGQWPGFRPLTVVADSTTTTLTANLRLRGNPRNEALYAENPTAPPADATPDDIVPLGRWKRPPRMGRYRFLLVVTTDTSELDFYARDCHRQLANGHYLNPFSYFLSHSFAHTTAQLAEEQLQVYMRPIDLGAPLLPSDWRTPTTPEHYNSAFRLDAFVSNLKTNVPVVADVSTPAFTPAEYNRIKHQYDDYPEQLRRDQVSMVAPESGATRADSGRIHLVNPAADPAFPHKYDAAVNTLGGFTYGRFRGRIRFPQVVNPAGVWTGLSPAFWLFSWSGDKWNAQDRTYTGDFCADDGRTKWAEIDIEVFKATCQKGRNYRNDGYPRRPRRRKRWLARGGTFQDETCDSVTVACNNFDYMRRSIPHLVNGTATDPPCGPLGNNQLIAYEGQAFRVQRYGASTMLATQVPMKASDLFAPNTMWFEIEWRPTEIIWRVGPDTDHLRVIAYMNDQYTVVPSVMMHVIMAQHWLNTNDYHPYFQEKIPFPARAFRGEILDFMVE